MAAYESYMVTCGGTVLCTAHSATATRIIAQTFTTSTPHTVTDIDLRIYKAVGTLVGNTYISLYQTSAGLPTTEIANTGVTILDADLTDQDSVTTTIHLPSEITVDGTYAIVLESELGNVFWRGQTTVQAGEDPYTGGLYCYNSGTGWIVPADGSDLMFTIYGNPIGTTFDCTNPNGYLNDVFCGDSAYGQNPNGRYTCTSTGWTLTETCEFGCSGGNCNAEPPIPPPPGIDTKLILIVGGIVAVTAIAFFLAGRRKKRK